MLFFLIELCINNVSLWNMLNISGKFIENKVFSSNSGRIFFFNQSYVWGKSWNWWFDIILKFAIFVGPNFGETFHKLLTKFCLSHFAKQENLHITKLCHYLNFMYCIKHNFDWRNNMIYRFISMWWWPPCVTNHSVKKF